VDWFTAQNANPATTVLAVLVCSIGFPFVVLSAGAPLLQKWFAEAGHSTARDPYFMYAASNLGSMVGLVAYPFFFERRLTLAQQAEFWLFGYLVLLLGIAACILRSVGFSERSKGDIQAPRVLSIRKAKLFDAEITLQLTGDVTFCILELVSYISRVPTSFVDSVLDWH